MKIYDIEEHGFHRAMRGLARSYNQKVESMPEVALKLGPKDLGHNKFLESIVVWMEVEAPRFWWSEMDTYRGDLEDMKGITKQSDSTMHTLTRRPLTDEDFEYGCQGDYLAYLNRQIERCKKKYITIAQLKNDLPDGFIQGRSICTSYKVLRNIILQRWNHRLPQWQLFCFTLLFALRRADYLGIPEEIWDEFKKWNLAQK